MAEKSEHEASTTGQDGETPEGHPCGYRESEQHVPDPTALTGTLETSGTGGGVHERLTGTTRIFGDAEDVVQRVETLITDRTQSLLEEVRTLILRQETSAQAAQIPQQTVEQHGLPAHQGNIIRPGDDTGAAHDAPRSANVAGSPDGVSDGVTRVPEPAEDSYQQTVIAGAGNPSAKPAEKDFEQAATDYADKVKTATTGKTTAAKKTTTRRQTGTTKK